nr:MAG TPA: hypothetical protein [Caudoviricetes sp.]
MTNAVEAQLLHPSCYQLATSNLKVINSLNDIQIGVVNWLYKWLESLKLSLALQLAKFRN